MTERGRTARRRSSPGRLGNAARRLVAVCVLSAAALGWTYRADAIIAGALPDTPEAHVDPNTPTSPWAGVGSVIVNGSPYSGVVIGPRHVLTAAHVAGDPQHTKFQLNLGGDTPQIMTVAKVHRHPGFKGFDPQHPRDDLAVLVLTEDVPAGVPIYPLHHGDIEPGTVLTFVGYGASGHGDSGVSVGAKADVKRVGRNTADAFGQDAFGIKRAFVFDFDGPGAPNQLGGGEGLVVLVDPRPRPRTPERVDEVPAQELAPGEVPLTVDTLVAIPVLQLAVLPFAGERAF